MPIYQSGSLNTAALTVPDLYVGIVPPQLVIAGVPSGILGVVGTASWGPVGKAVIAGDVPGTARAFGPLVARKFDLGTVVALASQQGAGDFRIVRVTDGTDAAATVTVPAPALAAAASFWAALAAALNSGSGVLRGASQLVTLDGVAGTLTALFTGTYGNGISLAVAAGSRTGTYRAVVSAPGRQPEVFDNIPSASAPTLAAYSLAGGTDGAAGVTAATLVGDETARTGLYGLRGQGCAAIVLADCDDSAQWSVQAAFGYSEAACLVVAGPAGDTIEAAITRKRGAGIDDWSLWVLHGDHLYWQDTVNGVVRLVSPAAIAAGRLVALAPNESPLNKRLYGILGSQHAGAPGSGSAATYSTAEMSALFAAGIDLVTNPAPGGSYWAVRCGHNSSSDAARNGLAYTRMTNFLATTINASMGVYVGEPISLDLLTDVRATLLGLFGGMVGQKLLGTTDGSLPYAVKCDSSNNPGARQGLGYTQADVQVRYQGINERFLVNLEGGATVVIGGSTGA